MNCLNGLLAQTKAAHRILVVDNNSTDGSPDKVKSAYPAVELLELDENLGFAGGNNKGFELLADCDWIALLNPDAIPFPNWIENIEFAILNSPQTDVFACCLVDAKNENVFDGTGDVFHVCGLSWRRHHGLEISSQTLGDDPVFSPCGAASVYRKTLIDRVHGFDESYFCYNEDVDMMFRMRLTGASCEYLESALVRHVGSGITGRNSDFAIYHGHRNLVWTFLKNMPGWMLLFYLPQHLILNLVTLTHYILTGRGRIIFRAKWHAVLGVREALRKRRSIQSTRTISPGSIRKFMATGVFRPYFSRFR